MSFWSWIAGSFADWEEIVDSVMPLSIRVGSVQMTKEEVATRAWDDPAGPEALAVRHHLEGEFLGIDMGKRDAQWNALQDQAERVGRDGSRSRGGAFGLSIVETSMVQLIIPGTYRVSIEGTSGGQPVTNVVGVQAASGQAQQAAAAVQAAWKGVSGPMTQIGSLYALTGFRAVDLSSANGGIAYIADSTPGGKATNVKATNAACALVKWNGGTRSRSSRGRLYFGPLTEDQINSDGRTLDATARTNIATVFANFRASLASAGFPLCVISPTTMSAFQVTSSTVESIIATQRRRIRD